MIASRNEMNPSAPRVMSRFAIDDVLPSTTSVVVSTTSAEAVARIALNSEVSPVDRFVAVAVMLAPTATVALNECTKSEFPF